MDVGNNQPAIASTYGKQDQRPKSGCAYCAASEAAKKLGMSGEHSIKGVNKDGQNNTPTCCHG